MREVGAGDQDARHQRQLGIEAGVHLGKGGNHEQVDDRHRRHHRHHHEDRIAQRALHALAHFALELEMIEQAQEDFIEASGHFPHPHHAVVKAGKRLRMAAHRGRQFAAGIERLAQVLEDADKSLVDGRFLQPGQAAHDRHAGLEQRMQLAAEQLDVDRPHLFLGQPLPPSGLAVGRRLFGQQDFHRRGAGVEQLIGDRAAVGAFEHALQQFAAGIAGFVGKERHGDFRKSMAG